MLIFSRINFLHMFCFNYKLFSKPFLRYCSIITMMNIFIFSNFNNFLITPISLTFWWIERIKYNKLWSTSHKRLINSIYLMFPFKFIYFLIPNIFNISFRYFSRFNFLRVICPFKSYYLSCRLISYS